MSKYKKNVNLQNSCHFFCVALDDFEVSLSIFYSLLLIDTAIPYPTGFVTKHVFIKKIIFLTG